MGGAHGFGDADGFVDSDVTKDHIGNIGRETEDCGKRVERSKRDMGGGNARLTILTDGSNTGVFVVEAGHEGDGVTAKVRLVVEGVLGVDEALTDFEGILDESSAVFENETNLKGSSGQHVEELGGTGMVVRRGQSARAVYVKDDQIDGIEMGGGQIGDSRGETRTLSCQRRGPCPCQRDKENRGHWRW